MGCLPTTSCCFIALRHAPAVEANLVNYLWPLFIVVLAPVLLPGVALRWPHAGGCAGIWRRSDCHHGGARSAVRWPGELPACAGGGVHLGQLFAADPARAGLPTTAIRLFGLVSGLLSLLCHVLLEPSVTLQARDAVLLTVLGLGPLQGRLLPQPGQGPQAGRCTAHRHSQLRHAAGLPQRCWCW